MDYTTLSTEIKSILDKSKNIIIVSHERPTADSIGSSLALYLGLQAMGKKVTIACPDEMTVELSSFIGVNKIVQEIGKKNFIISLDYIEGSIEKVSYNIEGDKFNLVIEPREGFETFSEDKVHYTHAGVSADAIICVDTIHLGGLKKLYEADKELYASKPLINIDRHPNNVQYGQVNFVDTQASSTAEVVYALLNELGIELNQDIATNLLNAVYSATNNFTNTTVTAQAFDVAAQSVKVGGKKFRRLSSPQASEEIPTEEKVIDAQKEDASTVSHSSQPEVSQQGHQKKQEAPADWLKPKIFKSSHLG